MDNYAKNLLKGPAIIYDGACPFCTRYIHLIRLEAAIGRLYLVNGGKSGPLVDYIRSCGILLDDRFPAKTGRDSRRRSTVQYQEQSPVLRRPQSDQTEQPRA
jgi:hypothetical protein